MEEPTTAEINKVREIQVLIGQKKVLQPESA